MDEYELKGRFYEAYHQPTSGSMGNALLKFLHEDMTIAQASDHFTWLERTAGMLQDLGNEDPHPMLLGMITKAFDKLLDDWRPLHKRELQMDADRERERHWYDDQNLHEGPEGQ